MISIVRISKLATVNYDDPTWRLVDVYVWTTLEDSLGITSACLPTMRECNSTFTSHQHRAKAPQGPLFRRFIPGASREESSNKKDSGSSSQRAAKNQFNRLFEESGSHVASQGVTKGEEDAWTSPDLATSNELFSIDKAPTRSFHPVSSSSHREEQHFSSRGTQRANYEGAC